MRRILCKTLAWLGLVLAGAVGGYGARLLPAASPKTFHAPSATCGQICISDPAEVRRWMAGIRAYLDALEALLPPPQPSTGKVGMEVPP